MPREIVHWKVIQAAISELEKTDSPNINRILKAHPEAAYLGAVSHDVPYYYRRGKDPFEVVGEYLHGREGEDTLQILQPFAAKIFQHDAQRRDFAWAFFFGMMSHVAADVRFHPMVYYFTGNYNDQDPQKRKLAQRRHRLFEVYLDYAVRPGVSFPYGFLLRDVLRRCGNQRAEVCALLESVLVPEVLWPSTNLKDKDLWFNGMSQMAFYQYLIVKPSVGALLRMMTAVLPRFKGFDSLMSYGRTKALPFFNGKISYRNPISGAAETHSIDELTQMTITDAVSYIQRFEACAGGSLEGFYSAFSDLSGASLSYGVLGARNEDGKFFSPNGAPMPDLEY